MPPPAHPDALPPAWRIPVFIIIALALMMMSIDATIVATALHALQQDLGAPINWTGWTVTAYGLGYVVMLPISGRRPAVACALISVAMLPVARRVPEHYGRW